MTDQRPSGRNEEEVHLFADQLLQPHDAGAVAAVSLFPCSPSVLLSRLAHDTRFLLIPARAMRAHGTMTPFPPPRSSLRCWQDVLRDVAGYCLTDAEMPNAMRAV